MNLVDVGVWLAGTWGRHLHHGIAAQWLSAQPDQLGLCRTTQLGLLRLITNQAVMGEDAITRRQAWSVLDQLRADPRVVWLADPPSLEPVFRSLSARTDRRHKLWTDDYLAALAQSAGATLVTLDRKLARRYPAITVETLI